MKFCTSCGTALEDDSRFCHECGTPAADSDELTSEPDQTTPLNPSTGADQTKPDSTLQFEPASNSAPATQTIIAPSGTGSQPAAAFIAQPISASTEKAMPAGGANKRMLFIIGGALVVIIALALVVFLVIIPNSTASATHTIRYETDGGSAVLATETSEGELVTSPANPVKDGYTFEGWYSDASRTQPVTFPVQADKDMVLYAKWAEGGSEGSSTSETSAVTINNIGGGGTTSTYTTQPNTSTGNTGSTVRLTVVGADGTTRSAEIHRQGSTQRVLPDSNTRRYSQTEVAALSDAERCIAWNEIIAASNGYQFKNSGLLGYFNSCNWYHSNPSASASGSLSAEASANVELLKSLTDRWWLNLATY